jgi:hypothetical protein
MTSPHAAAFFVPGQPPPPFAPAPEDDALKQRIDTLCGYFAKNGERNDALLAHSCSKAHRPRSHMYNWVATGAGPTFVHTMAARQGGNPEFGFLHGGPGAQYYSWALLCILHGLPATEPLPGQAQATPVVAGLPQVAPPAVASPAAAPAAPATAAAVDSTLTAAVLQGLPAEVSSGWQVVLGLLSGSRDSIRNSQQWFMACAPYAAGMAEMMLQHQLLLADYQRQLHVVYLANDILFKALSTRPEGTAPDAGVQRSCRAALPQWLWRAERRRWPACCLDGAFSSSNSSCTSFLSPAVSPAACCCCSRCHCPGLQAAAGPHAAQRLCRRRPGRRGELRCTPFAALAGATSAIMLPSAVLAMRLLRLLLSVCATRRATHCRLAPREFLTRTCPYARDFHAPRFPLLQVHQNLLRVVNFWGERGVYDRAAVELLTMEMMGQPLPAGAATASLAAAAHTPAPAPAVAAVAAQPTAAAAARPWATAAAVPVPEQPVAQQPWAQQAAPPGAAAAAAAQYPGAPTQYAAAAASSAYPGPPPADSYYAGGAPGPDPQQQQPPYGLQQEASYGHPGSAAQQGDAPGAAGYGQHHQQQGGYAGQGYQQQQYHQQPHGQGHGQYPHAQHQHQQYPPHDQHQQQHPPHGQQYPGMAHPQHGYGAPPPEPVPFDPMSFPPGAPPPAAVCQASAIWPPYLTTGLLRVACRWDQTPPAALLCVANWQA